jgi:hypothetical protein
MRVLPAARVFVSLAAAAVVATITVASVTVVFTVLSLLRICIALLQLLSGRHRRPFHHSFLVTHRRVIPSRAVLRALSFN